MKTMFALVLIAMAMASSEADVKRVHEYEKYSPYYTAEQPQDPAVVSRKEREASVIHDVAAPAMVPQYDMAFAYAPAVVSRKEREAAAPIAVPQYDRAFAYAPAVVSRKEREAGAEPDVPDYNIVPQYNVATAVVRREEREAGVYDMAEPLPQYNVATYVVRRDQREAGAEPDVPDYNMADNTVGPVRGDA
jgi:hypothetical protein